MYEPSGITCEMKKSIFVDTSSWINLLPYSNSVIHRLNKNFYSLITTLYNICEVRKNIECSDKNQIEITHEFRKMLQNENVFIVNEGKLKTNNYDNFKSDAPWVRFFIEERLRNLSVIDSELQDLLPKYIDIVPPDVLRSTLSPLKL